MDFESIPSEMKSLNQWVLWRVVKKDGRETKVPFQITGASASSTDSDTWTSFENVAKVIRTGRFSGLGFVFTKEAGLIGIDIDDCLDADMNLIKTPTKWTENIVRQLDSYTEISPSGGGLHIICKGAIPVMGCNDGHPPDVPHIEMYSAGRYFTITGDIFGGKSVLTKRQDKLTSWYDYVCEVKRCRQAEKTSKTIQQPIRQPSGSWSGDIEKLPVKRTTKELIKNGAPKGQRSEAIMTAVNSLIWSGASDAQIFAVFEAYPIGEKWRIDHKQSEKWLNFHISKGRSVVTSLAESKQYGLYQDKGETTKAPESANGEDESTRKHRFSWVKDIQYKSLKWTIPGLIYDNALSLVFGDPGSYKSFLAIDFACRIAGGVPFRGKEVRQGVVVIIAGEGLYGIAGRIKAFRLMNGLSDDIPILVSDCPTALTEPSDVEDTISDIKAITRGAKIRMIVIDTVDRNFGGKDENNTQDMRLFIRSCDQIRTEFDTAVLAIHHCGQGDKTRGRGSIALKGALDCEYRLQKDEKTRTCVLHCTKMKDAEYPQDIFFKSVAIDLGTTNEYGEADTSLILQEEEMGSKALTGLGVVRGQKQRTMIKVLNEMIAERDKNLQESGRAPKGYILLSDWIERLKEHGISKKNVSDNRDYFDIKGTNVYGLRETTE